MLLALSACAGDDAPPPALAVPVVVFGAVEEQPLFSYPARVHAGRPAELGFARDGRLTRLAVERGEDVARGQVLARLALPAGDVAPAELEGFFLRAPFDGVVALLLGDSPREVRAGETVLHLTDPALLELWLEVPARDVAATAGPDGPRGEFRASFSAQPGRSLPLMLTTFAPEPDPVSGAHRVTLVLNTPEDATILPGMSATVRWQPGRPAHTLPRSALFAPADSSASVWVVVEGRAERRRVELGEPVGADRVEVLGGLEPGARVAIDPVPGLREQRSVRALDLPSASESGPP